MKKTSKSPLVPFWLKAFIIIGWLTDKFKKVFKKKVMTREQKALRRLKEIEDWAQAWVDYWTEFEEAQKAICSYYDKPAAAADIYRYQIILDAIDGKIDLNEYPPESAIRQLTRFP